MNSEHEDLDFYKLFSVHMMACPCQWVDCHDKELRWEPLLRQTNVT